MVTKLVPWLQKVLDADGAARIEAAVQAAELRTRGEIVPFVVRQSVATSLVSRILGLLLVVLVLSLQASGLVFLPFWSWMLLAAAGALLGFGLGQLPFMQRWVIPKSEQRAAAQRRALLEFYTSQLGQTEGSTGVLLFVSLLEHQAVVLADRGIAQHCQPEVFAEVVKDLVEGARQKQLARGFVQAIERCTELLVPHFPVGAGDRNELKDHLRVED